MTTLDQISKSMSEKFASAQASFNNDNLIIYISPDQILAALEFLRDEFAFKILTDLFGADFLGYRSPRFEVIYNLLSLKHNTRITLKIALGEGEKAPSATSLFKSAGWYEREAFDMYGIEFAGNPDLRRILTDYGFEGHPMRKDFPLTGYKEVYYDEDLRAVNYRPVKLAQEYRNFDFEMPWEGPDLEKIKK